MLFIRNPADAGKLQDNVSEALFLISVCNLAWIYAQVAEDEDNTITLGLRLYTKGKSATKIYGQLRHGNLIGWRKRMAGHAENFMNLDTDF